MTFNLNAASLFKPFLVFFFFFIYINLNFGLTTLLHIKPVKQFLFYINQYFSALCFCLHLLFELFDDHYLCWGFTAQSTTMSCRAGQLIVVLFLGRLRPSKQLTSTKRGRPWQ